MMNSRIWINSLLKCRKLANVWFAVYSQEITKKFDEYDEETKAPREALTVGLRRGHPGRRCPFDRCARALGTSSLASYLPDHAVRRQPYLLLGRHRERGDGLLRHGHFRPQDELAAESHVVRAH